MVSDEIKAVKDGIETTFTKFVWDNMGPNKNGWVEIGANELPVANTPPIKVAVANKAAAAKALVEQALGFEKDNKLDKAMAKFVEAYSHTKTKTIEEHMDRVEKLMANGLSQSTEKDPSIEAADKAFASEDYVLAKELYETAINQEDEYVKGQIALCDERLLG